METPWTPAPRTAQVEAFLFTNSQPQMNEDNRFDGREKIQPQMNDHERR
jgi:hypothetical protein